MYSIIIVDDEPWIAKGISKSCDWKAFDCSVDYITSDPLDALNYIFNNEPQIIFTDINMGDISGIDIMREVRNKGLYCEFIIISGYSDFHYVQDAMKYNAFYYLLKPLDRTELEITLRRCIDTLNYKSPKVLSSISHEEASYPDNLKDILDYINQNYTKQLQLSHIAKEFHYNSNYVSDLISKTLGISFTDYILKLRIEKASKLLLETNDSISTISSLCGYDDYGYFTKQFKKVTGKTPTTFRKESSYEEVL